MKAVSDSGVGGSSPLCWQGPRLMFRVRVKPEGPKPEAQRAESDGGVLGEGKLAPHQLRGLESAASSLSGVRGGAPAAKRFSCITEAPDSLSWNLLGPSSRGHALRTP